MALIEARSLTRIYHLDSGRVVRFRDGRIVGDMRQVPVAADAGTEADAAADTAPEEAALP